MQNKIINLKELQKNQKEKQELFKNKKFLDYIKTRTTINLFIDQLSILITELPPDKNDKPDFVRFALDSMLVRQSVKPDEIVLVQDGPVPDSLSSLLSEYENKYPLVMHVIRLEKNGGLGNALKLGVENAKYNIIARMDSDDISFPERFQFRNHQAVFRLSRVGSAVFLPAFFVLPLP